MEKDLVLFSIMSLLLWLVINFFMSKSCLWLKKFVLVLLRIRVWNLNRFCVVLGKLLWSFWGLVGLICRKMGWLYCFVFLLIWLKLWNNGFVDLLLWLWNVNFGLWWVMWMSFIRLIFGLLNIDCWRYLYF